MNVLIPSVLFSVFLTAIGFPKWFFAGWKNPWRYRIIEKYSGRSYPQWRVFWWPFWCGYNNPYGTAYYYSQRVNAEAFIAQEIENYLAKQTKQVHYYPKLPPPLPITEIKIP